MAIDFEALKAKLKAQAAVKLTEGADNANSKVGDTVPSNSIAVNAAGNNDNSGTSGSVQINTALVPKLAVASGLVIPTLAPLAQVNDTGTSMLPAPTVTAPTILGTAKTTEIDHLDFLSKMNRLAEAIHTKHPTMPVLLMQIHKQLRADPELVTTLDEDAIGIVVSGLQVVTKTELVSVALKESKTKAKKIAISVDMF